MEEDHLPRSIRLVAVGDELLTGVGDPRALGWMGRVLSKTSLHGIDLQCYVLPVPGEGTEALSHRWESETASRFSAHAENYLLIALNDHDLTNATSARARLNLANILDRAAQQGITCLVLGPLPRLDEDENRNISQLNKAYQDVATRRSHPYVDAFTPLVNHQQWREDLTANGGHPGQAAYGLIAWLILHRGWHRWLGLNEPPASS